MLAKRIGANIKAARKQRGISLERLAAKVVPPTSYQQLSRLEKGDRALTVEWVERIANALGVDPLSLVAPDLAGQETRAFHLDEQVANEVARTLAAVATGDDPDPGTVQVVALMLVELLATFSKYPQAATDAQVARPVVDLLAQRFAAAAN
jgi:transcriptional regulator with XRE-family HTH domain